jgi:hypothetical protein
MDEVEYARWASMQTTKKINAEEERMRKMLPSCDKEEVAKAKARYLAKPYSYQLPTDEEKARVRPALWQEEGDERVFVGNQHTQYATIKHLLEVQNRYWLGSTPKQRSVDLNSYLRMAYLRLMCDLVFSVLKHPDAEYVEKKPQEFVLCVGPVPFRLGTFSRPLQV